jgi:hypothetical protein
MRALIIAAAIALFPLEAAAWNYGLENSRIETTNSSATDFTLRRVWALDEGNVVSRFDNPLATGGGDWVTHGNGGSPAQLFRWVRVASGGTATFASAGGLSWVGQYGVTISRNPSETIISAFSDHNLADRSVGMMRWSPTTGWFTQNLGHPAGLTCGSLAAIEGNFSQVVAGYRLTVACQTAGNTIGFVSASSESSTLFSWSTNTLPGPISGFPAIGGTVRPGNFMSLVHEFFVMTTGMNLVRIGVGQSSTTVANAGVLRDIDGFDGGFTVAPRSGSARVIYMGRMTGATRMFERRGVTTTNNPSDYRWLGSPDNIQFWPAPQQAAEGKVSAFRGTEAMSVMNRPGTGGSTDYPSVFLMFTPNQNQIIDFNKSRLVTKDIPIPGAGTVHHNYVGDPTVVMTDGKKAFSVQLGQVMAGCVPNSTITRSTVYMVSTTDGITHSAPVVIETKSGSPSLGPFIDHPWADIEHRANDTFDNDIIHITWWDFAADQIRYVQFFENGGLGTVRTLRNGGGGPPRLTATDSGRVVVYYGRPGGQVEMCELNPDRTACTTPPGSSNGWTQVGPYYYHHNVPVTLSPGSYIRSWYPISMALSERDSTLLHYCFEVIETDGSDGDVKCGRVGRATDGSWTVQSGVIVNAVPDDDKDQFLPEVAITGEDDLFANQDTVFAAWYDRAHDPANYRFRTMRAASFDAGATFTPPTAWSLLDSDPAFLPRHCRDPGTRFAGDYAAVEGDDLHKNFPTVVVAPGGSIVTWTFSFAMGLGAWGD